MTGRPAETHRGHVQRSARSARRRPVHYLAISAMPRTPASRRTWTSGAPPWMMLSSTQAHRHIRPGLSFGGNDEYEPGTGGRYRGHAAVAAARGAGPGWPV